MSRKFLAIALGTMMSAPAWAQGQTPVGVAVRRSTSLDTVRSMMQRRNPTTDEVRAFAAETRKAKTELTAVVEKLNRERSAADGMRARELDVEYRAAIEELLGRQRTLMQMCAWIRPHQGESEGVLGFQLDLDNIATAFVRGAGDAKEERFVRPPQIGFVAPGSPAEKADIRQGDTWVSIAGRDLVNLPVRDLTPTITPGSRVELKLRRDGREMNVEVQAMKRPAYPAEDCDETQVINLVPFNHDRVQIFRGGPAPAGMQGFFTMKVMKSASHGAVFADMTNEQREALPKVQPNEGVFVETVATGSAAEVAGLRAWDVVTRANNQVIASVADLLKAMQGGAQVSLWVVRGDAQRGVILPAGR